MAFTLNGLGQITSVTDSDGEAWTLGFDNGGRLLSWTDPLGRTRIHSYDNRGRDVQREFPDGSTVETIYRVTGRAARHTYFDAGGNSGYVHFFNHDANGRVTSANNLALAYDGNGRITESNSIAVSRDAGGRITSITEVDAGQTIAGLSLAYNAVGLVTSAQGNYPAGMPQIGSLDATRAVDAASQLDSFQYDEAERLQETSPETPECPPPLPVPLSMPAPDLSM